MTTGQHHPGDLPAEPDPPADEAPPASDAPVIRGRHLRYLVVLVLDRSGLDLSPSEIDDRIRRAGFRSPGRPGKAVSDALRWAVANGQVRKVRRGRYAARHVTKQTRHRYRRRIAAHRTILGRP